MKHTVRSTLVALGLGVMVQRLLQLATFVLIGNALGAERLGVYAMGLGFAALLGVLSGAGVRNLLAREVAAEPGAARALVLTAVRSRLAVGTALLLPAAGAVFAWSEQPWFFAICLLQVLPAAFDLKNLLDATGRAAAEVAIETGAAALQLALVLLWLAGGGSDLATLAAIALLCRCLYAGGAAVAIARLPRASSAPRRSELTAANSIAVSLGQTAHEVMAAADVWLVAVLLGNATAGIYAVAVRIATAAMVPSGQLARLLLPHMLRSAAAGDPARTAHTALRATAFATLPVVAGGVVVAAPLSALCGAEFELAATPLRLLLVAATLQHLGWQISHSLFAARRDRAYAGGLLWPALLHATLLGMLWPNGSATGAALAMLAAHATYLLGGALRLRRPLLPRPTVFVAPLLVAGATGTAAAAAGACVGGSLTLPTQLLAGALAFVATLWAVELRGRLGRIGDGLATASGLVQRPLPERR